ncbi:raffinose/stachyose/melibiose transport system permease protein [Paenibacillus forsythiae]|uniref:Raffinose/stachyose/melibiose transport system permease protein n=1 Tax=Paenibacillus forsythiae TaxID=365616 RepID=A0ABU3H4Q2_9BACL|nr:carbohydrate ABC transporter permease [Paenibacillus forsythiae]MDT3425800.1 raffinose/stachyose/melibiose transport system permease protein [Paenibacillus forsythiae]
MSLKQILIRGPLLILLATQIYPLFWLLLYSLKTTDEIMKGSFIALPDSFRWGNYAKAFTEGHYLKYLWNSIIVTCITVAVTILLSTMVSYALARFKSRMSQPVLLLFMIGIMIPIQSTLLPLMIIFRKIGILDTHLSLILPYVAFSIPIAVMIMSGFMRDIPYELEESAFIDGASILRMFFSIVLPISMPPVMTVCILTFISNWNEYIMAATFLSSVDLRTLPFGTNSFMSQNTTDYGALGAYLVMSVLPVILIYFFLSEKITSGMMAGAVKG